MGLLHIICYKDIRKFMLILAMQDIFYFFFLLLVLLNCFLLLLCSFSTGFTSVHGESPSAEYAKLRKESLESEFGHALGANRSKSFSAAYRFGPFLALYRAAIISFHVLKLTIWQFFVQDIRKRAIKVIDKYLILSRALLVHMVFLVLVSLLI